MNEVITFFFSVLQNVWNTITSHWLLSIGFMITIVGYIVNLINSSKSEN